MDKKEIRNRIGYVRNLANLSAREVSLRMGLSQQYVSKLENGRMPLKVDKLIDLLTVCNFPIEKFFYSSPNEYDVDKELLSLIKALPKAKKEHLIEFLKQK